MTPEAIQEVWGFLDRDALVRIAQRGPTPLFATISGAHLYGFASPDSDVDLRGAFVLPADDLLGLFPAEETLTIDAEEPMSEGGAPLELDWVAHDVRKFCRMLTAHNGYALEQLFSPLVVIGGPLFEELRELAKGCITRPTVRHYYGFARGRRKRLAEPDPTVKHLLYAYRVYLSGIHLMLTGQVEANLETLASEFALPHVDELIARKRQGTEFMALDTADLATHEAHLSELEKRLTDAHARSGLPEEPQGVPTLNAFVLRARRELGAPA